MTPGPRFTKLFCRTKFVNATKRHSAANFVKQMHVVNGFVKLAVGQFQAVAAAGLHGVVKCI